MMRKRGATHVDWAISMGLFVVYILSMFLIIQPGAQKVFREDNLISIVENSLLEGNDNIGGVQYTVEIIPLYIEFTVDGITKMNDLGSDVDIVLDGYEVDINVSNDDHYVLYDSDGVEVPLHINVVEETGTTEAEMFTFNYDFGFPEVGKAYKFYLYFMNDYPYDPLIAENRANVDLVHGIDFTPKFGSAEKHTGIRIEKMHEICAGYEDLKQDLGYPPGKEFRVYYVGPSDIVTPAYMNGEGNAIEPKDICDDFVEPYEQADVFVKELVTASMNDTAGKEQLRINIRVW